MRCNAALGWAVSMRCHAEPCRAVMPRAALGCSAPCWAAPRCLLLPLTMPGHDGLCCAVLHNATLWRAGLHHPPQATLHNGIAGNAAMCCAMPRKAAMPGDAVPCCAMPLYAALYYTKSPYAARGRPMLRYAALCYAMLHYAALCWSTLRYAALYCDMSRRAAVCRTMLC
jgi:hypothetical protein